MENKQALRLLLTSNVVSGFAQGISMLAIPWYFAGILGIPATFGLIYAIVTFGSLFWSLYTGTLIDKYSRKTMFLLTNVAGGIVLGSVAVTGFVNGIVPNFMVGLVFMATIFIYNMHYPNLYAFAQEITERKNYGRITSYLEIQGQATSIFSGTLAAVLLNGTAEGDFNFMGVHLDLPFSIQSWTLQEIFLMNAITYIISIGLISFIRYKPIAERLPETGSVLNRIKTGFNFLLEHKLLFLFGTASYTIFVLLLVETHLLLPIYVHNHLNEGADVYASAEIYYAVGALFAGISIRWLFKKTNSVRAILVLMVITTLVMYVCTFTRSALIFFMVSLVLGITNAGTRVLRVTYLFEHVPNSIIGRTSSVFNVLNILMRAFFIGLFSLPFFVRSNNVIWAYFIFGTYVLVAAIIMASKYKELVELKSETEVVKV
jgi:MFS transporter, DHA3 family, macrolide efflux protein